MSDSAADELGDMLLVIKQRHAELVELQTQADSLLKAIGTERRKLDNDHQNLAAAVSMAVESAVGKAQKGLQGDLSASSQQVRGMVEKAKNNALNTVLWAVAGSFLLGLLLSIAFTLYVIWDVKPLASDLFSRIAVIEKKLKIKN